MGSAPEELTTAFDGIQFYSVSENKDLFNGDLPKTLKDVAEVSKSIGLFESAPDLSGILDLSVYK